MVLGPGATILLAVAAFAVWAVGRRMPVVEGRARWLAPAAAAAFVAVALYPIQRIKDYPFFFGDEMTVVAASLRVADGALLYRDVWEFLQPGSFMLLAAIFRAFGRDVAVLDSVALGQYAVLAGITYAAVARHVSARAAWLAVVAFLLLLTPLAVVISPHWMGTAAGLGAIAALVRHPPPGRAPAVMLGGACLGLTFLFQQHKGVFLGAAMVSAYAVACVACGARVKGTLRAMGLLALGGVLVAVPLAVWLTARGLWGEWWYATYEWVMEGYAPANKSSLDLLPFRPGLSPLEFVLGLWNRADFTVLRFMPLVFAIAPLTLFGPRTGVARWRVWLVWAGALGIFGTAITRYDILRLLYTAPATLVLVAFAAARVRNIWPPPRRGATVLAWATVRGALVFVLCIAAAVQYASHLAFLHEGRRARVTSPRGDVTLWSVGFGQPADARVIITALQGLPRNTGLFVYPTGWGYGYLSGLSNGTPYHFVLPGYTRPAQWKRLEALFAAGAVDAVVWERSYSPAWMPDVYPTLPPSSVWDNPFTTMLQGPEWRPWVETDTVTLYRRTATRAES